MRCQECDKDAVVHVTDVVEGSPEDKHYCEEHGKKYFGIKQLAGETLELTKSDIEKGTITVPRPGGVGGMMQVKIPPGAREGDVIASGSKPDPASQSRRKRMYLFGSHSGLSQDPALPPDGDAHEPKCCECGKDAAVHMTEMVEGRPRVTPFCQDCAKEHVAELKTWGRVDLWPEEDVHVTLKVTESQIGKGCRFPVQVARGLEMTVQVPPGMKDGDTLVLQSADEFGTVDKGKGRVFIALEVVPEGDLEDA